jgi:hypothetical protein
MKTMQGAMCKATLKFWLESSYTQILERIRCQHKINKCYQILNAAS